MKIKYLHTKLLKIIEKDEKKATDFILIKIIWKFFLILYEIEVFNSMNIIVIKIKK